MIEIRNTSDRPIHCIADGKQYSLAPHGTIAIPDETNYLQVEHLEKNYACKHKENKWYFELLRRIIDPFGLAKDYYIHVDAYYNLTKYALNEPILIFHEINEMSGEFKIRYQLFVLRCDKQALLPEQMRSLHAEELMKANKRESGGLFAWEDILDVFVFGIDGAFWSAFLCLIAFTFSFALSDDVGNGVWFGFAAVVIGVIWYRIHCMRKKQKEEWEKFEKYLDPFFLSEKFAEHLANKVK
ncbi:MAG: hypothetical protein E7269_02505 [Lachnospiraceae bacterium]|nr:hypothetical protein [Lachnospiraceae bacterium]